jgi:DNA invertase Pin-like site-specific DNA recombinase
MIPIEFQHPEDKSKVRVLSYTRFSTRKQAKGSSTERQVGMARDWCKINGYTLDESEEFADKGVFCILGG